MFNPYFARPIGSDRFEQHLLTLMTQAEEKKSMEKDSFPEVKLILSVRHEKPAEYDPVDAGWKALDTAIFAQALVDYLLNYAYMLKFHDDSDPKEWVHFSRCVDMENTYFRTDPDKARIFDYILVNVVRKDFYIQDRIRTIKDFARKIEYAV